MHYIHIIWLTFPTTQFSLHHEPKTPSRLWPSVNYKTWKGLTRQQRFFFVSRESRERKPKFAAAACERQFLIIGGLGSIKSPKWQYISSIYCLLTCPYTPLTYLCVDFFIRYAAGWKKSNFHWNLLLSNGIWDIWPAIIPISRCVFQLTYCGFLGLWFLAQVGCLGETGWEYRICP